MMRKLRAAKAILFKAGGGKSDDRKPFDIPAITIEEVAEAKSFFAMEKFFIFGHARSGTTLLTRLVRVHPEVYCNYQGHFFTRQPLLQSLVADPKWRKSLRFGNMELSAVSIGSNLEARAIALYKKCAETTTDPDGRKVFEWLVLWEEDHLKWMQTLEDELKERYWADQGFSPM